MTALNSVQSGEEATPRGSAVRPARDEAALLYQEFAGRVRGYVAFRVRETADVDDLVGEVFRRVVSGPLPSQPEARPAWIFRVTHNVVVDHYRRRRTSFLPEALLDRPDDAPSLADRYIQDERLRATDVALRQLPGRQRAAIYLRFYEDLTYDVIGSILGIPVPTARSLVHRGLKRLASVLDEETRP